MMRNLPAGEVHIWIARRPATLPPGLERTLSAGERDRARRFHFADHQSRYIFAHAVLRDVLSQYMSCTPGEIRFDTDSFGKPFVVDSHGTSALEFNLSHAGHLVLVAVCGGRRIGIDVEEIRPMADLFSIAKSHYTTQECAFIFRQMPADQGPAFFRCWTRKEAYVKALGKGLSMRLNSFDTLMFSGEPSRWLGSEPNSTNDAIWQLVDVNVPEGYMAAVAVETESNRLIYFEWRGAH